MTILFNNNNHDGSEWLSYFAKLLPNLPVYQYPDIPDPKNIKYAIVWNHPVGDLQNYPNLKAILNLGAGSDWLDHDNDLPKVPVVRLVDPAVGVDMANFVLYWVMHFHRGFARYQQQQAKCHWQRFQVKPANQYRVTVLGLGMIGRYIAEQVSSNGYCSQAWNRSLKSVDGVETFYAQDGLECVLAKTDVLVNCLPHTDQTENLLNRDTLSRMPEGACFINVSRGGVVDHNALMQLLDDGHLANATLDTFVTEPLSENSSIWRHNKINVTPHMSGATYANTAAKVIANNIMRMERGERPSPIYPHYDV